jgi:hypothetical protein
MYETHIILIPTNSNKGRKDLERIENMKFASKEGVRQVLCFDEDAPMETENLLIFTLTDFMDACNNTDSVTPEDEKIDILKMWIGYVQIHK